MAGSNKDVFLARLMRERDRLELIVNRLGFTRQIAIPGVLGKWSIKDMLAHLLGYEQYIADRMEEILSGEIHVPCKTQAALDAFLNEFGYPDFGSPLVDDHAPGDWVIERYRNVSLEEVVAQEIHAFASILSALEKMDEETLERHSILERVADNTYKHYRVHIRDIRRWMLLNAANSRKP